MHSKGYINIIKNKKENQKIIFCCFDEFLYALRAARHGLTLSGKLRRVGRQEEEVCVSVERVATDSSHRLSRPSSRSRSESPDDPLRVRGKRRKRWKGCHDDVKELDDDGRSLAIKKAREGQSTLNYGPKRHCRNVTRNDL